jgi:formylmethanofuran dehydrogenase subunit C
MSGLTLTLRSKPGERLNLGALTPGKLAAMSSYDVSNLNLASGKTAIKLGDAFSVSGALSADTPRIAIQTGGAIVDFAGMGLDGGEIIIEGDGAAYAGRGMKGGKLTIKGNTGSYLGAAMSGGTIHVAGNAGDMLGSVLPGDRFGMTGGTIVVGGDIGARAGDKMRRGTVVVKGKTGPGTGTRMIGGTVWAEGGLGPNPGFMMRRGTLIAPTVASLLPTFSDCGRHDLLIVRILSRHLKTTLGDLAPRAMPLFVQKIAGDMATIGRGEILLPA